MSHDGPIITVIRSPCAAARTEAQQFARSEKMSLRRQADFLRSIAARSIHMDGSLAPEVYMRLLDVEFISIEKIAMTLDIMADHKADEYVRERMAAKRRKR